MSCHDNEAPVFGSNYEEPVHSNVDAQVAQLLAFGIPEDEVAEMVEPA